MPSFVIHRTNKHIAVISDYHLHDMRLSLGAIGLMSLLLYMSDDDDCSLEGLASISTDSVEEVRELMDELASYGYVVERQGSTGYEDYDVFPVPEERS